MVFANNTIEDIDQIFTLYDAAVAFQKTKFNKHWLPFDREMIMNEIHEHRHFKIIIEDQTACIFSISFDDAIIWGGDERNHASIYLHRIVTNPAFRGYKFVTYIKNWALNYGALHNKKLIRMDTWGDNQKLIDYYVQSGFTFIGLKQMEKADNLPKHYEGVSLSLFEIEIEN